MLAPHSLLPPVFMIITSIKEFKIQHEEAEQLLRVEWVATADIRRLRAALDQLQQLAERLQVTHVLVGLTNLPDISPYDQIWIGTHWLPKVFKLPLQQAVLVLQPTQVYNQHAIETLIKLSRPFIKFDIHFFSQSTAGMHWLLEDSLHQAAILHEWEVAFGPAAPPLSGVAEPLAKYRRL